MLLQGLFIHSGPFGRSARWQRERAALRAPGGAQPLSSLVAKPHLGPAWMSDDKGLKRFNGEAEDPGKELKRWKAWALAKCLTMKDLKPHQRGPWLFTLLDGAAYETNICLLRRLPSMMVTRRYGKHCAIASQRRRNMTRWVKLWEKCFRWWQLKERAANNGLHASRRPSKDAAERLTQIFPKLPEDGSR